MWVYDTPQGALGVVVAGEMAECGLVAYRLERQLYRNGKAEPFDVPAINPSPVAEAFVPLGFDVVSRSAGTSFECSPLSWCNMAAEFAANEWCLFDTHDQARVAALAWSVGGAEPGPYVVIEVLRREAV